MYILITGSAGFIGFHLSKLLLKKKINVVGIDNLNSYYDLELKKNRLKILKKNKNFSFHKVDISNKKNLKKIFLKYKIEYVINLAAQAGVRYSISNPGEYLQSNIIGFYNILEISKDFKIKHLLFASTSSVYGNNDNFPLKENFRTDSPLSFYAATKKSNEVMAHAYSNIFNLPITGLRFFTVYGPYGRPDMSLYLFTEAILKNKKVNLFNKGDHVRDFTYVDDVVGFIYPLIKKPPISKIPFDVYNVANGKPKKLKYFLSLIEKYLDRKSKKQFKIKQPGDVYKTHGSISKITKKTKKNSTTPIEKGVVHFLKWYLNYNKIKL
jgi:UDP-glucuronate 4-epimerase